MTWIEFKKDFKKYLGFFTDEQEQIAAKVGKLLQKFREQSSVTPPQPHGFNARDLDSEQLEENKFEKRAEKKKKNKKKKENFDL